MAWVQIAERLLLTSEVYGRITLFDVLKLQFSCIEQNLFRFCFITNRLMAVIIFWKTDLGSMFGLSSRVMGGSIPLMASSNSTSPPSRFFTNQKTLWASQRPVEMISSDLAVLGNCKLISRWPFTEIFLNLSSLLV